MGSLNKNIMNHDQYSKTYTEEIQSANDAFYLSQEAPIRGSDYASAAKRYKQSILIEQLNIIIKKESADMTPTMASNIIKKWLGRSISRKVLSEKFGTKNRTAAEKSKDLDRLDYFVIKYENAIKENIKIALRNMKNIRETNPCT
mgnify:CR=1 FL=1